MYKIKFYMIPVNPLPAVTGNTEYEFFNFQISCLERTWYTPFPLFEVGVDLPVSQPCCMQNDF